MSANQTSGRDRSAAASRARAGSPGDDTVQIGSLFSGYGGLDLAVQAVLGGSIAWHVEIDPDASRVLSRHWPDVPNLGDIAALDWTSVDPVDVLTGGFPCQDVSYAGRRAGLRPGTRSGLWSQMAYAVSVLRPRLVIAENVRGLLGAPAASQVEPCPWCVGDNADHALRALGAVLGDLADLGYDTAWCGLRAADVGAPHSRFRVFIAAADTHRPRPQGPQSARRPHVSARSAATDAASHDDDQQGAGIRAAQDRFRRLHRAEHDHSPTHAHADRIGPERTRRARRRRVRPEDHSQHVPDTDWGIYAAAIQRWESRLGRPAPTPTVDGRNGARVLNAAFVEWMQGIPEGWVTGTAGVSRRAMLRVLGNGVVPQQATAAVPWLLDVLAEAAR